MTVKKTKPNKPRNMWERKPGTQVVPNKKGVYSRKAKYKEDYNG